MRNFWDNEERHSEYEQLADGMGFDPNGRPPTDEEILAAAQMVNGGYSEEYQEEVQYEYEQEYIQEQPDYESMAQNTISEYGYMSQLATRPLLDRKVAFELNGSESQIVNSAMIRLEQARLYETLIKSNFFEGVEANQLALDKVNEELKTYIVQRLEILMGLKEDTQESVREAVVYPTEIDIEMPFNDKEINFLKQLASAGSNKDTLTGSPFIKTVEIRPEVKQEVRSQQSQYRLQQKPWTNPAPVKTTPVKVQQPTKTIVTQQPIRQNPPQAKSVQSAPAPVKKKEVVNQRVTTTNLPQRSVNKPMKQQIANKRPVIQDPIIRAAMEDINNMKHRKPVDQMTDQELEARNQAINEKYNKKVKNPRSAPMMTQDQANANAMLKSQMRVGGGSPEDSLNQRLASIVSNTSIDTDED